MKKENLQLSLIITIGFAFLILIVYMIYNNSSNIEIVHVTNNVTVVKEDYVPEDKKVNVNTADFEEFLDIEGIGEKTAQKIIDYRNENGKFESIYELQYVISEKLFESIKKWLTI